MSELLDLMIEWENGQLSHTEIVALFQDLVDYALAWSLGDVYAAEANRLLRTGEVTFGPRKWEGNDVKGLATCMTNTLSQRR